MLSKIFANIKLGSNFWLVALALMLWGGVFFVNHNQITETFLNNFILEYSLPTVFILISVFTSYFLFDQLYRITKRNYYIPLIFVLIWSWQPELFTWQNSLSVVLLVALYYSFQRISENATENISHYLNVGIISFLVSLLTPYGIYLLVLSLLNKAYNNNKNWRQLFLPFYGYAMAFGISYGIAFITDVTPLLFNHFSTLIPIGTDLQNIQENLYLIIPLALLFSFSVFEYFRSLGKAPVVKQKILGLLIWHFGLAALLLFLYNFQTSFYGFIFFPTAILFANHLQYLRKFLWREIWIWVLIAMNFIALLF